MASKSTPLPINQITLIWDIKSVTVGDKFILKDVSGYCKAGEMLAIMGPSGAGKTTLLSLLANKKSESLQIQGEVHANNKKFTPQQFYNFGVYIYQNDILHEMLTVKQTLQFIARLKIPNEQDSQNRVKKMISIFNLQKCQDVYIGGKFKKGISGGEKKRVCIAVEMISDPSLLILDEPTSGLDSNKALSVIKMLKQLAEQERKTIILTLHQPSFLIYENLDRLLLLNKGRTVYQGKASQIYNYMRDDLQIVIPQSSTLSDFFMMEISEYKNTKYDHKTLLNEQNYNMKLKAINDKQIEQAKQEIEQDGFMIMKTVRSFMFMFSMLMGRQWTIFKRNPMKGGRMVGNAILSIVMIGLIFLNGVGENRPSETDLYSSKGLEFYFIRVQGSCFIAIVSCIMTGIFSVSLACTYFFRLVPTDREIFYKETSSKKYSPVAYLISKILIESGAVIFGTIIFAVGCYFMIGFTVTALQLVKFVIALSACALVGNSLGILTGSLFKQANRASALTPVILLPLMMFSGLYNKLDSIPVWIRWLQYISPFRYGLQSVILNEFGSEKFISQQGIFDYREYLSADLSYEWNIIILVLLSLMYYSISFVLLKKLSSNLAP